MEARVELRKQFVALRREGKSLVEISQITGYARTYCSRLAREFDASPRAATRLNRGGCAEGTGRKLSTEQEEQVQRWIRDRCPDQLRLPFALWTLRAVQELIRRELRIRLPKSTTALYLSRWGFTSQRPKKRAYERSDAAVKRWLEVEYPKIARRAKQEKAEVCWGNETGLHSDQVRHRGYAPKGQTPLIRIPARAWLASPRDEIEVFFLPPYSPEVNPDEYLDSDLKRAVYTDVPAPDQAALHRQALGHLRRIQKSAARVAGYFQHPAVRYAARANVKCKDGPSMAPRAPDRKDHLRFAKEDRSVCARAPASR